MAGAGALAASLVLPVDAWARVAGWVAATPGVSSFLSAPDLGAPTLTVNAYGQTSAGYLFVTTLTGPGKRGPMIVDDAGAARLVSPDPAGRDRLPRQIYKGARC